MDIVLSKEGDLVKGTEESEADVLVSINDIDLLVRRALMTPYERIGILHIENNSIKIHDKEYGNKVYRELSENMTISLIGRLRTYTIEALEKAGLYYLIGNIDVSFVDFYTVNITVQYFSDRPDFSLVLPLN